MLTSKTAGILTREAYLKAVSAHGPKRATLVSPKVRQYKENAAGGFFQQTHSLLDDEATLHPLFAMSGEKK